MYQWSPDICQPSKTSYPLRMRVRGARRNQTRTRRNQSSPLILPLAEAVWRQTKSSSVPKCPKSLNRIKKAAMTKRKRSCMMLKEIKRQLKRVTRAKKTPKVNASPKSRSLDRQSPERLQQLKHQSIKVLKVRQLCRHSI